MEQIRTKTGKAVDEITIDNILNGSITAEDIKVSRETLLKQAAIAKEHGRPQLQWNFERGAEMIDIPDQLLLQIYNRMRPNRSTKQELLIVADMLEKQYGALECAKLVRETAQVYEKRGILRAEG